MRALLLPNMVGFPSASMERYARELLAGLRALGEPGWEFDDIQHAGAEPLRKLIPGNQGEKWASRAGRFITYPMLASRASADVYHVLDHSHANLALAVPGERAVATCHDVIPYLAATGKIPMAAGRLTRYTFPQRVRCMRRCRFILADSEATRRDLHEFFGVPEEQVVVVYLGRNPVFTPLPPGGEEQRDRETREIRARHGVPDGAKIVFHIAGPLRYKNTPAIIRALKRLREKTGGKPDVWFLRASGEFFPDEENLIRDTGMGDRTVHVGKVATDDGLAAYYRAADAFVFPSLYEGFGWPPLEAMACGTPAVTSNAASLPEVVGDAGITVPPNDIEALADALHDLLTDEGKRAALRAKMPAQVAKFTWENCARDTLGVYKRIVGEEGSNA